MNLWKTEVLIFIGAATIVFAAFFALGFVLEYFGLVATAITVPIAFILVASIGIALDWISELLRFGFGKFGKK